ncbi:MULTISPECIES: hypothetical protein [unclassified Natrinema]|uniref:hypothetical protein n=1 Tax=unclassified Natrinema TaxID=2622230 RepID=UPI00026D4DAB|nr:MULTISPECIES: hypothetical protein [unclassified Natrinema]AFO57277.1 hypothetical protein NJ7G_2035 [Natrinema sp. J7-2]
MTRFAAAESTERRSLYVDAITAHRERESAFLTVEADEKTLEANGETPSERGPDTGESDGSTDPGVPWVQFGDGTLNLDCTDEELEALKRLLESFPAFKIDDLIRPEEAEGVNVRISAKADANRIAQFIDRLFLEVYDLPAAFRVWVVDI